MTASTNGPIVEVPSPESGSALLTIDVHGVDEGWIAEHFEALQSAGFAECEFTDNDQIATWGALYLDGETSVESRRPEPAPRPPEAVSPGGTRSSDKLWDEIRYSGSGVIWVIFRREQ